MPHLTSSFGQEGPTMQLLVRVSLPRKMVLTQEKKKVPNLIPVRMLIDTGASSTLIDNGVIEKLEIPATGTIPAHTPSTNGIPHHLRQFDVSLVLSTNNPENPALILGAHPVVESHLACQGIQGLIGRAFFLCVFWFTMARQAYFH